MPLLIGAYSQLSAATPSYILERGLTEIYKPLLTYIYKRPEVKLHLYLSAYTLEWFEQNHPEMNMLIADLVKKEQLELLSGSYHQSIIQLIPSKDRSTQLEMTTTLMRKRYGKRPRTAWFFNQVWNSSYLFSMSMGMLNRLIISPYDRLHHQIVATEPFVMQEMGKIIEVFPLEYRIEELIASYGRGNLSSKEFKETLSTIELNGSVMMVNCDQILQASALNSNLPPPSETLTFLIEHALQFGESELLSSLPSGTINKKGYLHTSWYGRDSSIVDIGSFNEIFIRYEELNQLYGRLLYLMELTRIYKRNKDVKKRVESLIDKATCSASYVFDSSGGCYRNSYRKQVFKYLNEAQRLLSSAESINYPQEVDLNFDQRKEIVWQGKNIGLILCSTGGSLSDISYLPTGWNYQDTFSGYAYEVERTTMSNLIDGTFYRSFGDLLLPYDTKMEKYGTNEGKMATRLSQETYTMVIDQQATNEVDVSYTHEALKINKRYKFKSNTIVVEFTLTNKSKHRAKGLFGSELNLSIGLREQERAPQLYTVEKQRNRELPLGRSVSTQLKNFRISDNANRTLLSFASDERFLFFKEDYEVNLATIMGNELLYQHTTLLPLWSYDLASGATYSWTIGFRIERKARSSSISKEIS